MSGRKHNSKATRLAKFLLSFLAIILLLFYGGGGIYFSNTIDQQGLSAKTLISEKPTYNIMVRALTSSTITLALDRFSPTEISEPGTWGLEWPNGYGQITTIISHTAKFVVRRFQLLQGQKPKVGALVAFDVRAYPGDPSQALGFAFQNVYYPGPLGNYPAWFVPGNQSTWAIMVHGNGMTRRDGMRMLPPVHKMGLPTLMITYRNDPGAPSSKSGLLRYGLTEWLDLQAAVKYSLLHGAKHVVLLGFSMGGGIVTNFLIQSPLSKYVSAVVLDAPMLDFSQTVNYDASLMTLPLISVPIPQTLTDTAKWIAGIQYGVQWSKLDYLQHVNKIKIPILLFQGLSDKTVPPETSNALAKDLPQLVTYVTTPDAGHLESWNLNPKRYDAQLTAFLTQNLAQ